MTKWEFLVYEVKELVGQIKKKKTEREDTVMRTVLTLIQEVDCQAWRGSLTTKFLPSIHLTSMWALVQ